jgi:hypothetical protein
LLRQFFSGKASLQILIEGGGAPSRTAPLDKAHNLDNPHTAVERDGDDVTGAYHSPRRRNPRAIDPDKAGAGQCRGGAARAHQARMPQPAIDALARDLARHSAALLGICFELRFQGGKLGERRIGIGSFFRPFVPWLKPLAGLALAPPLLALEPLLRPPRPSMSPRRAVNVRFRYLGRRFDLFAGHGRESCRF